MPIKQVNSDYDYISISDIKNDFIDASVSVELPLSENEVFNYSNCIVVFFDYDYSNPRSKRTYKLFKYYINVTRQDIENDFNGLGKLQGVYILSGMSENKGKALIEKLNKRHISI